MPVIPAKREVEVGESVCEACRRQRMNPYLKKQSKQELGVWFKT
jgi:hypothetical protein